MIDPRTIVDILLEGEADDMDAFVQGSGILTPGTSLARSFEAAKAEKDGAIARGDDVNRNEKGWFYTPAVRFGDGKYEVHANAITGKAFVGVHVTLPDRIKSAFNIYDGMQSVEIRKRITTDLDPENIRAAADKLYAWAIKETQRWENLAYCRRTFKKLAPDTGKQVGDEFRSVFKDHRGMAGFEHNGYAKTSVPHAMAAKMAAWMRARVAQLGIRESEEQMNLGIDMDKFLRDAGVTVSMDDFLIDSKPQRCMGYSNGNTEYYVSYKRLLYKGKPVYLGKVVGYHDYNRTGHSGHVGFYIDVPTTTKEYFPMNKRTGQRYKRAKYRTYQGYGAVRFNQKEPGTEIKSLFDACKYLLSLLKIQHPLKQAESLIEAAESELLDELGSLATDPILIPSKVKVDFLTMDQKSGDFYFTVSLLRSRHSYRHFLGTLKRSHTGDWFIEDMPEVILRKRVEPYPDPNEAFPTDLAAERALVKHIIRQFPGLLTPRW